MCQNGAALRQHTAVLFYGYLGEPMNRDELRGLALSLSDEGEPLTAAMRGALADSGDSIELPAVQGLNSAILARWLYRRWQEQASHWRPFLSWDPALFGGDRRWLAEALEHARGGWLHLREGWRSLGGVDAIGAQARRGDVMLVLAGRGQPVTLTETLRAQLVEEDRHHDTATDPALDGLRRSVAAHARAGGVLHLRGEPGTGRGDLVALAHARLGGDLDLDRVLPGAEREPRPGRWVLFERVEECPPGRLLWAEARGRGRAPSPVTRSWSEVPTEKLDLPLQELLDSSPGLHQVLHQAQVFKGWLRKTLLLSGETGSGKGVLARAIHEASRPLRKFVHLDLNAVNPNLVESELFGHVKGAFNDARESRLGLVREAHEGTLLLDEIGRLPLLLQQKLLVVVESGRVRPVGADKSVEVDVRWLAATNRDLEALVRAGEFLPDLLHRLRGAELRIPPLRARPDDIALLAAGVLDRLSKEVGGKQKPGPTLSPEALQALRAWTWPGNVRELVAVVEAAAIRAGLGRIEPRHLGELAHAEARCPVFLTSSLEPDQIAARPAAEAALLRRLTTLTLEVPALRHRDPASLRARIFSQLDGQPVDRPALDALTRRPWYGNLGELEHELRALRVAVSGPITYADLEQHLPHLVDASPLAPLLVLMHPSVQPDGTVSGLLQSFDKVALIIGRGGPGDLRAAPDDERLQARLDAIRALTGEGEPGVLSLGSHPELSRQHAVVRRCPGGLELAGLPGTVLLAAGGKLGEDHRYKARAGERVPLGQAGEVQVRAADGSVYLQLFVFTGRAAYTEQVALLRKQALLSASPTRGHMEKPRVCWILSDDEVTALNDVMMEIAREGSGHYKGALRAAAGRWKTAGLEGLAWYIDSSHPAQSCTRLYDYNKGHPLVARLEQRLAAESNGADLWERLPSGVRDVVRRPGPVVSLVSR